MARCTSTMLALLVLSAACAGEDVEPRDEGPGVRTLLGDARKPDSIQLTLVADAGDGLAVPRDLGFHPERVGELWIVSRADDGTTIVFDATTGATRSEHRVDPYALHFMEEVSSVAFGAKNFRDDHSFGTCQESRNTYDGAAQPNDFMGPALWSANLDVFAIADPIGLGSHLDMLHHSPLCMGIAHDRDNVYWVFDGYNGKIVRYDFQKDHDAGYDYHGDGIIYFMEEPRVERVPDVPSHMVRDASTGYLYVADTGNSRVLRLDTTTGRRARSLPIKEPDTVVEEWNQNVWDELVPAGAGLTHPSGVALHDGLLYVGDNATGVIHAFDLEGVEVASLSTGLPPGALMGLEAGPDERLYFVDAVGNRVLRIDDAL